MRHPVTRPLSVVLMFLGFSLSVSLFGQNRNAKKSTSSSSKTAAEATVQTTEGPAVKVKAHIEKERRTPSAGQTGADEGDSKPVETPSFRVMSHPREDRLVRGYAFHGDVRKLPQIPPEKFERPEFEEPASKPAP